MKKLSQLMTAAAAMIGSGAIPSKRNSSPPKLTPKQIESHHGRVAKAEAKRYRKRMKALRDMKRSNQV